MVENTMSSKIFTVLRYFLLWNYLDTCGVYVDNVVLIFQVPILRYHAIMSIQNIFIA